MEDDNLQSQNEAEIRSIAVCFCVFVWNKMKGLVFQFYGTDFCLMITLNGRIKIYKSLLRSQKTVF